MPRRFAPGNHVFHVFNRAIAGTELFGSPDDYLAFERLMAEALSHVTMRILAYCLMPNHWHLMLWPIENDDLSNFMHWLTLTHAMRWRKYRETSGRGHVYQGRFKGFPVEKTDGVICVGRYVERNAQTANLVQRAEDWRFGSLWRREHPEFDDGLPALSEWPVTRPENWVAYVNEPQTRKEIKAIRRSFMRGCPFGSAPWRRRTAAELGLESTMRSRGRPRKNSPGLFISR